MKHHGWVRFYAPLGLLVLGLFGLRTISQADFWTHLVSGRWIAAQGIPRADGLSLIQPPLPWVDATWLYDRLLYACWSLGGAALVTLLNLAGVVLAFTLLVRVVRGWSGPVAQLLALLASALLLAPQFEVGPQTLGLLCAAVFMHRLVLGRLGWAQGVLLLGVQVLWTNTHPSFVLGPLILLVFTVEHARQAKQAKATAGGDNSLAARPAWQATLLLALAAAAVTLVNPYGWHLHRHLVTEGFQTAELTGEWISPFSGEFGGDLVRYVIYLVWALCALGLVAEKRRLPLGLSLLALLASLLVVRPVFSLGFFALLLFPFLTLSLEAVGTMARRNFAELLERLPTAMRCWGGRLVLAAPLLLLASLLSNHYYYSTGSASAVGWGVNAESFPAAVTPVLARPDFPGRTINALAEGGYVLWHCPQRRVLVDGRSGVYPIDLLKRIKGAYSRNMTDWAQLEQLVAPGALLLNCVRTEDAFLAQQVMGSGRWRLAYFDGTTAVLLRLISENAALLEDNQIRALGLQSLEKARRAYAQRVERRWFPAHSPALIGAGNLYMALGRYGEAELVYALLAQGAPNLTLAWLNLGICKLEKGQAEAALPLLRRATQGNARDARVWLYLGRVCTQLQRLEEAKEANQRGAKLNPELAASFLKTNAPSERAAEK